MSAALQRLRDARIGPIETYTPSRCEDRTRGSPIPLVILAAGLLGRRCELRAAGLLVTLAYPLDIGGRPDFAWPSFMPTVFENAVLIAVVAGFFGFLLDQPHAATL